MNSAPPGSLLWLLRWQTRAALANLSARQRWWIGIGLVLLSGLLIFGGLTLRPDLSALKLNAPLPDAALPFVALGLLVLWTMMVAAAVNAALAALFTRGDMTLLLHSPTPPRTVLASRALGVALSAGVSVALLMVPLLLIAAVLGVWRAMGLLGWWLAAAVLAACAGLWLTLGLVRILGVQRTRTVSAVLGSLIGAAVFLAFQLPNLLRLSGQDRGVDRMSPVVDFLAGLRLSSGSLLALPVQAAWSEPVALLALLGAAGLSLALTVMALTRLFVLGAQTSQERATAHLPGRVTAQPLRFRSARSATLLKEWRLIWRDPALLSRTLLQLLYLLPLLAPALRGGNLAATVGVGVVLLTSNLAVSLAQLTLNAEDAPDLLRSAPRSPAALRQDKWLAASLPPLGLGLIGLALLAFRGQAQAAAIDVPLLLLGVGGSALMVLWQPLPLRRADLFKRQQNTPLWLSILTLVFQMLLAGTAYLLNAGQWWGLGTLALALAALAIAYGERRSDAT
jgi:ABC-2 type transport system permease protein